MKNAISFLVILVCFSLITIAQSPIDWQKANVEKSDGKIECTYIDSDGNIYAAYTNLPYLSTKIKGASIVKYSPDLKIISRFPINGDLPDFFIIKIFFDNVYIIPLKIMGQKNNPAFFLQYDLSGNFVKKIEFDPEYTYSLIIGNWASSIMSNDASGMKCESNFYQTKDKKNFIVWGYDKFTNPNNKADNNNKIKVMVFNKEFEKISEETFIFEELFSNSSRIETLRFDFTSDNKIVALCTDESKIKTSNVFLAVFIGSGEKPTVYKYNFNDGSVSYEYSLGTENDIFISGIVSVKVTLKNNPNKTLFYINQSLTADKAEKVVNYNIADDLFVKYPYCKKIINNTYIDPFGLYTVSDGVIFAAMNVITKTRETNYGSGYSSKTKYFSSRSFVFIKFTNSGKIEWLKMIIKDFNCSVALKEMAEQLCYQEGDKLSIIYCDSPQSIINKSNKVIKSNYAKAIPALAQINSDGEITIKALDKITKKGYYNNPKQSLFQGNQIILFDFSLKTFGTPSFYIGKVQLAE